MIGVIGAAVCNDTIGSIAYDTGREIALRGAVLICGGLGGVMAAAARGAREAGGLTIGLLPGTSHSDANPDICIPIPTGLDHARNVLIVRASHGLIAISGGYGTLSEIGLALKMRKSIVGIQTWVLDAIIEQAETAREAVERLYRLWI
ncbi:TIGR00725 family protein [bacterium]|nr:TIGR00725 family protein [candidate division CSSED10-310 bacterium]